MTAIFADTFYFFAMLNPRDEAHRAAVSIQASLRRPLVTTLSFGVMADRGLDEALTGDQHFEQAGFRALLKPSS